MPRVSLSCFGTLPPNGKDAGLHFYELAKRLLAVEQLGDLYVLRKRESIPGLRHVKEIIPFGHYLLGIAGKLSRWLQVSYYLERGTTERLFDVLLAKRLRGTDASALIYSHECFPVSARIAQTLGMRTFLLAPVPHCDVVRDLVLAERERLGPSATHATDSYTAEYRLSQMREFYSEVGHIITGCPVMERSFDERNLGHKLLRLDFHTGIGDCRVADNLAHKSRCFRVLYVAHTVLLKGLHYLLEAWKTLALRDAELIIVGSVDDGVKRIIDARKLNAGNVRFDGHQSDLRSYYESSHLFACPSLIDKGPKTVWEAVSCGTPVLVTENCGASGVIKDGVNGFVVPIRDAHAIAMRILNLYRNRDLGVMCAERARQDVERYRMAHFSEEVVDAVVGADQCK